MSKRVVDHPDEAAAEAAEDLKRRSFGRYLPATEFEQDCARQDERGFGRHLPPK